LTTEGSSALASSGYVLGLRPFIAIHKFVKDNFTFMKSLVSLAENATVMHEDILAFIL
jgi:hypothetical protein